MLFSLFEARKNYEIQVEVSLYFYLRTPVHVSLPNHYETSL